MNLTEYDVAVIGGGPAGMLAAGRAAELGASVILLEKNATLGNKLCISGGGRCNILHAEFNVQRLVAKYGKKGKALFSTFAQYNAQQTWDFFEDEGLPLKIEAEQRAFPVSNKAQDVQKVLLQYMQKHGVTVRTNAIVTGITGAHGQVTGVQLSNGTIVAKKYILATGGKSRPETGSTGEGFTWLQALGHTIIVPEAALVPISLKDPWIVTLAGISLQDVKIKILCDDVQIESHKGKMLFTHIGLSGPLILNMSKRIGQLLAEGNVTLLLDVFPALDHSLLDTNILTLFADNKTKQLKNVLGELVPPRLAKVLLELAKIPAETRVAVLTREQRAVLVQLLKAMPLQVQGLLGTDKAVVTSGGLDLREVIFSTMQSKLFNNLYVVGDVLDFDRPSGGFSLQICWSTGFVAGSHAAK